LLVAIEEFIPNPSKKDLDLLSKPQLRQVIQYVENLEKVKKAELNARLLYRGGTGTLIVWVTDQKLSNLN